MPNQIQYISKAQSRKRQLDRSAKRNKFSHDSLSKRINPYKTVDIRETLTEEFDSFPFDEDIPDLLLETNKSEAQKNKDQTHKEILEATLAALRTQEDLKQNHHCGPHSTIDSQAKKSFYQKRTRIELVESNIVRLTKAWPGDTVSFIGGNSVDFLAPPNCDLTTFIVLAHREFERFLHAVNGTYPYGAKM